MWFQKTADDTLRAFGVLHSQGLNPEAISTLQKKYGKNALKAKKKTGLITKFLMQFKDMLIYVLLGAAVITLLIREYTDAIIILVVVLLNAAIGLFQENKAEKAIESLQKLSSPKAVVRRGGQIYETEASELVPGDIVLLEAGRYVPADLRLLETANLKIEESALTGESVSSEKEASAVFKTDKVPLGDQLNMAFMSTLVTYGRGEGIVVTTGMNTEMGKIAKLLDAETNEMTPLQKRLEELGKTLGIIAIVICFLVFGIGLFQGRPLFDMFLTAISLAVAAIPEGLAAIVAIVLALGVTRMSKINAIVKKLPAVETLGSVNVICSDKTGTLTQNKMTVVRYWIDGELHTVSSGNPKIEPSTVTQMGHSTVAQMGKNLLAEAMVLCTDATYNPETGDSTGDPTEIALLEFGLKQGLDKTVLSRAFKRLSENPFDSNRKLMSTLHEYPEKNRVYVKGAIDQLIKRCTTAYENGFSVPLDVTKKEHLLQTAESMSAEALRVLAAAYKTTDGPLEPEDFERDLTFIGFVGMIDPPREEVKKSIASAIRAGIRPVMITGDHQTTAVTIAKSLGIAEDRSQSMTGAEIDALSDEAFAKVIDRCRVFARVSPENKVKIVTAFQSCGNIVSMTGDGVNDAPSLKRADIGVAMGITGTDVSKDASDMILLDDNFTTIVHAIEEGRNIYANIKKTVVFLLSCNLGEVITIVASILFSWPIPLLPTQILWINLITDSLPAIALGVDPDDPTVMNDPPRDPKESFFAGGVTSRAITGGVLIGVLTLAAFTIGVSEYGYSLYDALPDAVLVYARTMAFVVLAASQLFYALSMRHAKKSVFQIGLFSNPYLIGAILFGFILQFAVISVPSFSNAFKVQFLGLRDWGIVIALSLIPFAVNEAAKHIRKK
ncbi:MAG: P-type Ca2+ transporter type [Clostridiales bacterium]|jgi:Ca2+-transporting ATPase|nr:P-type Ca2+ transporter type [Clostridiales bacterium]